MKLTLLILMLLLTNACGFNENLGAPIVIADTPTEDLSGWPYYDL